VIWTDHPLKSGPKSSPVHAVSHSSQSGGACEYSSSSREGTAYGTNKYGVRVACGDIDGDGMDEIITGPGPSELFGSHVRGWNYDGTALAPMNDVSYFAFHSAGATGGVVVACGDIDNDGNDEILTAPGPLEENLPWLKSWNYDGEVIGLIESKTFRLFEEGEYVAGANVALGNFYDPPDFLP